MAGLSHGGRKNRNKPNFKLLLPEEIASAPWNVPDLCTAYSWPTNLAGGGVFAIVELGGGWDVQRRAPARPVHRTRLPDRNEACCFVYGCRKFRM